MSQAAYRYCRRSALLATLLVASQAVVADDCAGFGDYSYVCGPVSAEDLVVIPETRWLIASGFGSGASLYLVDARDKTWTDFYPDDALRIRHDKETYATCPAPLDATDFVAHGLNIRAGADGHSTLFVVGHGGREAIEVFDVDANADTPILTWTGCVPMPDNMEANSVASFADGSLVVTIPLHPGLTIADIFDRGPTGAVYSWAPGDSGFSKVDGTDMGYANGIETSSDGSEFYVASSADLKVYAFSNTSPARRLRETGRLSFVPDNLHMGRNGQLLTAGLETNDPDCGELSMTGPFDLEAFASCNRGFTVLAVDPDSMSTSVRASSGAHAAFSNVTMAVEAEGELWIGTFAGDRIAYISADQGSTPN